MNIILHKGGFMVGPKKPPCLWAYNKLMVFNESDPDESTQIFRYQLPDGLSLRSVGLVNGVPELRFSASPKVPTLQEGDIAAAFRLAAEKKRPEFSYVNFPLNHPFHSCRWLNNYDPKWLRETTLGDLLADVDWNMKCLHIGARSDEDKTTFRSWHASSNLKGLATRLDFPRKENMLSGSIKMYCDYAKVQKTDDEIFFPEEPKMKIVDQFSESYSEYITEHLPSVAYHDEPKFLKMQEVIKLILAVEWLYNEKKVRVDQNWVQFHTENISEEKHTTLIPNFPEREEVPSEMIPTPSPDFEPPSTDATICTTNSEPYDAPHGGLKNYRYGYINFGGSEARIFTDEGEKFLFQNCIKFSSIMHTPAGTIKGYDFITLDDEVFERMKKFLCSIKCPFFLQDEVVDEDISSSDAPTLQLPKACSMRQVRVALNTDVAFFIEQFQTAYNCEKKNSGGTELSQTSNTDCTEKESDTTTDKSNIPIAEGLTSEDSEVPNSQGNEDEIVQSPESQSTEFITDDHVDILAEVTKDVEENNIFGPLEALLQNLEESSANNSPESQDVVTKTMKICMESIYEKILERSLPFPATICISFDDEVLFEDEMKFSLNVSISRHAPFTLPHFEITGTVKWASEDLDFLFSHIDPNASICIPVIAGLLYVKCIPGVQSWKELLSEMSTPVPRFWQDPYTGSGIRSDMGGVSTTNIPVIPVLAACATTIAAPFALLKSSTPKFEPPSESLPKLESPSDTACPSESENVSKSFSTSPKRPVLPYNNKKRDNKKPGVKKPQIYAIDMDELVVRPSHIKGTIQSLSEDQKAAVTKRFQKSWMGHSPEIITILKINNIDLKKQWKYYGKILPQKQETSEEYYHGATLLCNIAADKKLCSQPNCGICTSVRDGFNDESCKRHRSFSMFEKNFILDHLSSSADENIEENKVGHKAVLLCDVLAGRKYNTQTQNETTEIPENYDSIFAVDDFQSHIIILPRCEAILPRYIIVFKHSH